MGNLLSRLFYRRQGYREASQEEDLSVFTSTNINSNVILSLDDKNLNSPNKSIKIISILNCKNSEDCRKRLEGFRHENFPNAFIVCFSHSEDITSTESIKIRAEIGEKFLKTRPILLQISSKQVSRYFLRKPNDNFKEINVKWSETEIRKKIKETKFSTELFLNIQAGRKIYEANSELITKHTNSIGKIYQDAIQSQDDLCMRLLMLFGINFTSKDENDAFALVIKTRNNEKFYAFFEVFNESEIDILKVKELLAARNHFVTAAESNNITVVEFLLKIPDVNFKFNEALKIAIEKDFFTIFSLLKSKVSDANLIEKGEEIFNAISNLHESIIKGNQTEVENFCKNEEYKSYRFCFGKYNICALELAIDKRQLRIFSLLEANGFQTDNEHRLESKKNRLSENQKTFMRLERLKYVQDVPDAFIGILLSKCKFDACSPVSSKDVHEMLVELSNPNFIVNLRPYLEIASQAEFKVIFDFATKCCKKMVPGCGDGTMGLAYFSRGELYVGRDEGKYQRYGTFIHELTHFVLYLIYENGCLPYCEGDTLKEEEWQQILEEEFSVFTNDKNHLPEIIRWVFEHYDEGYEQRAELAVRVNHIMARYCNDQGTVSRLREVHLPLFNYLQSVVTDLQTTNVLRLITLNKSFDTVNKIELQLQTSGGSEIINQTPKKIVLSSNVSKLALSKLIEEIKNDSHNKLDLKVKNIFVDVDKLDQIHIKNEFENLLESSDIDRIVFDVTEAKHVDDALEYLRTFNFQTQGPSKRCPQVIVVCDQAYVEKFVNELKDSSSLTKDFEFDDLADESKCKLFDKVINFQGRDYRISIFLNTVSKESLPILCSEEKIVVNFNENLKSIKHFIPRFVERQFSEYDIENFMTTIENDKVIVISDKAGSGKTSLLLKIGETYLKQYPQNWISFVGLREYVEMIKELSKNFPNNFIEAFAKILKLNALEEEILTQKFQNGEVKIFFDAFDEISPICKQETLRVFELFMQQNKNQIFITTRKHLEYELEINLNVESYEIRTLTRADQVKFLCNYWRNSNDDKDLIKMYAEELTNKIDEIVRDLDDLIGVPIIIQSIAKLYVNDIDEHFGKKIKNLKLSQVYRKILDECLENLNKNFPTNVRKRLSPLQVLEYHAIVVVLGQTYANKLGLYNNENEWPLEEITRYGLISFDKDGNVSFNHKTCAEHLVAIFMVLKFTNLGFSSKDYLDLLSQFLSNDDHKIIRMFIDEMLENFIGTYPKFENNDTKMFNLIVEKKLSNLFGIFINSNLKEFCYLESLIMESLLKVSDNDKAVVPQSYSP